MPGDESLIDPRRRCRCAARVCAEWSPMSSNAFAPQTSRAASCSQARPIRPQPSRDEKILVGLNGLAIEALASSARTLRNRRTSLSRAQGCQSHLDPGVECPDAAPESSDLRGKRAATASSTTTPCSAAACSSLYEATQDKLFLRRAQRIADALLDRFDSGPRRYLELYVGSTSLDHGPIEQGDEAYPSGTSASVDLLAVLQRRWADKRYAEAAARIAQRVGVRPQQWPTMVAAINIPSSTSIRRPRALMPSPRHRRQTRPPHTSARSDIFEASRGTTRSSSCSISSAAFM